MKQPTEEQLMSFADGKLDEETRQWVAQAVESSPELAHKVAIYRATGGIIGDMIDHDMAASARGRMADDALAREILSYPLAQRRPSAARNGIDANARPQQSGGGTVVQFPGRTAGRGPRGMTGPNLALAAGVAALLAGALAMTMLQWRSTAPGLTAPGSKTPAVIVDRSSSTSEPNTTSTALSMATLDRALESTPSNQKLVVGSWTVSPVVTFKANDGRYCREYTADGDRDATVSLSGVACRSADGWVRIAQALAAPRSPATEKQGQAGRKAPPEVEKAIRGLWGSEDAIDTAPEERLIKGGWK